MIEEISYETEDLSNFYLKKRNLSYFRDNSFFACFDVVFRSRWTWKKI